MKLFLLVLTLLALQSGVIGAQERPAVPEYSLFTFVTQSAHEYFDFHSTAWQTDSQSFRFSYYQETSSSVFQYSIASNELRVIGGYGLSGLLNPEYPACPFLFSETQSRTFRAVGCANSVSPNGRYIVYPIEGQVCGESCSQLLALGDLKTGDHATIRKPSDVGNFVRWGEDSSAFLVMDYGAVGGVGGIWYIPVPANMSQGSDVQPTSLAAFPIGDIGYVDISPDGQQVLVRGNGTTLQGLTLWDARLPSSNQQFFAARADGQVILSDQKIVGASFVPDDPQHLLVVLDQGIVLYDLQTEQIEVIQPEVNAQWVDWAYFSPDVQYVLTYNSWPEGLEGNQLSLFEVSPDNTPSESS